MNDAQFAQCMEVLSGCWPRYDATEEQAKVWRAVVNPYRVEAVCDAIRDAFAARGRFPPSPDMIRERLQGGSTDAHADKPPQSEIDFLRDQIRKAIPSHASQVGGLADHQVRERIAYWEFCRALQVYGPDRADAHFWRWQTAAGRPPPRSSSLTIDHDKAAAIYREFVKPTVPDRPVTLADVMRDFWPRQEPPPCPPPTRPTSAQPQSLYPSAPSPTRTPPPPQTRLD